MSKTFIIAEAGVNHGGNFETALKLVDAAKEAGADAVKFQLFSSQKLWGDNRIKHLELSRDQMQDIAAYCMGFGIEFMCTPFGVEELEFLAPLLHRIKIASGCLTKEPLLRAAENTHLPVIISTGMSVVEDIYVALNRLADSEVTVLHCTSSYPCRLEDVNLNAMRTLKNDLGCPIGYSDHTDGITVAVAAVALGAAVIEKHLTLDRRQVGPDHLASIEPLEFKFMCEAITDVETALGDGVKRVMDCEKSLRRVWRD